MNPFDNVGTTRLSTSILDWLCRLAVTYQDAEAERGIVDARVLLLSDCVHNAGPDPRLAAAGLARLDVLLDASGEHDEELARDLARLGRGRLARVRGYRDVAPAVSGLFAR
jgi:hypothetical protein